MSEWYWNNVIAADNRAPVDARPLIDRAEVEELRDILGCRPAPSWWAVARDYIAASDGCGAVACSLRAT